MPDTYYPLCRSPRCSIDPEPGYADRGLCAYHEQAGLEALAALPDEFLGLIPLVWDKTSPARHDTGRIAAVFGPSEPGDWNVDALIGEIDWTVDTWHEIVRDRAGLSDPRFTVWDGCEALTAHWPVLIACPPQSITVYETREITAWDGIDAIVTLTRLHERARGRVGQDPHTSDITGACDYCGRERLTHRNGSDHVKCRSCFVTIPWEQYEAGLRFGVPLAAA